MNWHVVKVFASRENAYSQGLCWHCDPFRSYVLQHQSFGPPVIEKFAILAFLTWAKCYYVILCLWLVGPSVSMICGPGSKIEKFTTESDKIANCPLWFGAQCPINITCRDLPLWSMRVTDLESQTGIAQRRCTNSSTSLNLFIYKPSTCFVRSSFICLKTVAGWIILFLFMWRCHFISYVWIGNTQWCFYEKCM
jgi:hypothetical protein